VAAIAIRDYNRKALPGKATVGFQSEWYNSQETVFADNVPEARDVDNARSMVQLALLPLILGSALVASAADPVAIATILADPEPHHMRIVTLQGRVTQVQLLEPYFQPSGTACHNTYLFTLEDDTGSLDIAVLGLCGAAVAKPPDVSTGDIIRVQAQVQAPGHLGTFYGLDGRPHPGLNPQGLYAIAKDIAPRGQ